MGKPTRFKAGLVILFLMAAAPASAADRHYCIAADEILWDYAPSFPTNLMTGEPFTADQRVFVEGNGDTLIGRIYRKAVYRQYAYDSGTGTCDWTTRIDGPKGVGETLDTRTGTSREHLGILGPIIRGVVGDTIFAHFRNNTPGQTLSIHPHGVFYEKDSEGAPMDDGTSGADKADDAVPPGGTHDYVWPVPTRAGPGPSDVSSAVWVYHSHTDEVADTNTGLIGAIVITGAGAANPDATPAGVARGFFSLFTVFDENACLYLDSNIAEFAPKALKGKGDPDLFEESNLMHGINGLVFGNNMGYTMTQGENVRWYLIGMGTEVDLHTPHWHGVTVLEAGHRKDVAELSPATAKTFDLDPDNPGNWMFHCHVNDHILAGMTTMFTIDPPSP